MMMTLYKKSVHSFLGFTSSIDIPITPPPPATTAASATLGLATATSVDSRRSPNVVESSAVKSTSAALSPMIKKDPGGIGFIDDIGGGVNGLMSCTESLGFESSDERRVDNDDMSVIKKDDDLVKPMRRRMSEKKTVKNYPPPIPSLNQNGQPSFFLRPLRKDGRLELTEVWIDRPEILRASREDGRLKLQLVGEDEEDECEEDDDEEEDIMVDEERENNDEELIKFPGSGGGGEGFRRCNEVLRHHNHYMHAWSQQAQHYVTTS